MNLAGRNYLKRFIPMMVFYVVALMGVVWIFLHHPPHGVAAYLLASLPAVPIIGVIVIVGLYLGEEQDEFLRALQTRSMMWGIGLTLAITTVWGFIENFTKAPHLQGYLVFPIFCVAVCLSRGLIERRYR